MNKSNYWAKRYAELMDIEMTKAEKVDEALQRAYFKSAQELEYKLTAWLRRYMKKNGVSLPEARRQLARQDREELQWTISEYIANGNALTLDDVTKKKLENASIKYHVTRLEALQAQITMQINDLYAEEQERVQALLADIYPHSYYTSLFERERVKKKLHAFNKLPEQAIRRMLEKPYTSDGLNFSDRIWKNRDKLITELNSTLLKGLIQGRNVDKQAGELAGKIVDELKENDLVNDIKKKMKNARVASTRLIITEASFFANQGVAESCKTLGADKYQLIATLDRRTSPICQSMDLQVFNLEERQVGVSYPPFHCYCRTVATPYDEYQEENDTRIARDKDGKTIYIPHDMTYKQWYNKYIEEAPEQEEERKAPFGRETGIKVHLGEDLPAVQEILKNSKEPLALDVWNKLEDQMKIISTTYPKGAYHQRGSGIALNLAKDRAGNQPYRTLFHESGHQIDYLARDKNPRAYPFASVTYKGGAFEKALNEDWKALVERMKQDKRFYSFDADQYGKDGKPKPRARKRIHWENAQAVLVDAMFADKKEDPKQWRGTSDVISGLSKNKVHLDWGHRASYWRDEKERLPKEAFANMYQSSVQGGGDYEAMKAYFPTAYSVFLEILEEIKNGDND